MSKDMPTNPTEDNDSLSPFADYKETQILAIKKSHLKKTATIENVPWNMAAELSAFWSLLLVGPKSVLSWASQPIPRGGVSP